MVAGRLTLLAGPQWRPSVAVDSGWHTFAYILAPEVYPQTQSMSMRSFAAFEKWEIKSDCDSLGMVAPVGKQATGALPTFAQAHTQRRSPAQRFEPNAHSAKSFCSGIARTIILNVLP
jgi:hypothetical protein